METKILFQAPPISRVFYIYIFTLLHSKYIASIVKSDIVPKAVDHSDDWVATMYGFSSTGTPIILIPMSNFASMGES
jgi:hypothetical protein